MKYLIEGETLTGIADTIREISGNDELTISGANLSNSLNTVLEEKTIEKPAKGIILKNYNIDGKPLTIETAGYTSLSNSFFGISDKDLGIFSAVENLILNEGITTLGTQICYRLLHLQNIQFPTTITKISKSFDNNSSTSSSIIKYIYIPNNSTCEISNYAFRQCGYESLTIKGNCKLNYMDHGAQNTLKQFIIGGQVEQWIPSLNPDSPVELYDFSGCDSVFTLQSISDRAYGLPHIENCLLKIKASLLYDWQNATNWSALEGFIWEGIVENVADIQSITTDVKENTRLYCKENEKYYVLNNNQEWTINETILEEGGNG